MDTSRTADTAGRADSGGYGATVGVLAFETKGIRPADGTNYLFGGVEKARFRRQVIPGDRLDLESKIVADRKFMMKFECTAYVDGALACSATLTVVEQSS